MELFADVINNQLYLYIPVALVLAGAILVFTFGFKSAEQPPFDKLSTISDDKKATSKKRKTKDKKVAVNGNAVSVGDKSTKEKQSNKETPTTPKVTKSKEPEKKKPEVQKLIKSNTSEDQNNKKSVKAKTSEKPVDFDEGTWETVPTKNDKKTKKQESPVKKSKKTKKADNDNLTKDSDNQNDDNKENLQNIAEEIKKDAVADDIPVVEEKNVEHETSVELEKEVHSSAEENVAKYSVENPVEGDLEDTAQKENTVDEEPIAKEGAAFDELGDVWADTKAVKKSKKKSRRD